MPELAILKQTLLAYRMQYHATLRYTGPLLRRVVNRHWRGSLGPLFLLAQFLVASATACLWVAGDRSWLLGFLGATLLFSGLFAALAWIVPWRHVQARLRAMQEPVATWEVDDQGFTVRSRAGASTLPWSAVTHVTQLPDAWLLYLGRRQFMTIPLQDVPADMQAAVLARLG